MYSNGDNTYLLEGDCLKVLAGCPAACAQLVIADLPWNTGGVRTGANGASYSDRFTEDEFKTLVVSLAARALHVLEQAGSFCLWLDYRWAPYAAVWTDEAFGRVNRVGEIVVQAELGNPGKSTWPVKHSNILLYAKDARRQYFDHRGLPLEDRRASKGKDTAYDGAKRVNSVLRGTMSNTDPQRTGYPDQKPSWIYRALVESYTREGQLVVDPFAGSGTLGEAVQGTGRNALLIDQSPAAVEGIIRRFSLTPAAA